jgi:hypothetical protein
MLLFFCHKNLLKNSIYIYIYSCEFPHFFQNNQVFKNCFWERVAPFMFITYCFEICWQMCHQLMWNLFWDPHVVCYITNWKRKEQKKRLISYTLCWMWKCWKFIEAQIGGVGWTCSKDHFRWQFKIQNPRDWTEANWTFELNLFHIRFSFWKDTMDVSKGIGSNWENLWFLHMRRLGWLLFFFLFFLFFFFNFSHVLSLASCYTHNGWAYAQDIGGIKY